MTRAVVFGYHNVGCRCLEVLLDQRIDVPLVVTHRDDPNETIWFDSVAALARERGIETMTPADPDDPEVTDKVRRARPDFLFSFYYRSMLKPALLSVPGRGAFNMHGSLLPKYRGRAPVNWAIIRGESETGATLHEMVEKPDAGRIVDQEAVPILPDDLAVDVFDRVTGAAARVMARSLPKLVDGSAALRAQDLSAGSYFGGRKPEDGRIDWRRSARDIHNLVRAVAPPYPGAFTALDGGTLRVLRTRLEPERAPRSETARLDAPCLHVEDGSCYAACVDGHSLLLVAMEYAGKAFTAGDFLARFGSQPLPLPIIEHP